MYPHHVVAHVHKSKAKKVCEGGGAEVHPHPFKDSVHVPLHLTERQHTNFMHSMVTKGKSRVPRMKIDQLAHHHQVGGGVWDWFKKAASIVAPVAKVVAPHLLDLAQKGISAIAPGSVGTMINKGISAGREHFGVGYDGGAMLMADQFGGSFVGYSESHAQRSAAAKGTWSHLSPAQKAERLAKMKAGRMAKKH